ncbi:MAG: dihydrodipicolinate synthase family protein [Planctomycetota bacterium]|nr:MAG: dihydrodipicolinate synthase family protein [Planctomycetota bacterium]
MAVDWRGVYAAATTEFHADEALDVAATKKHFERLIDGGIHGLVVMGTVGEGTSLDADEKREVLRAGIEASRGRVPVVTGVAEYTTRGACRWAAEAEKLGADGLMVLPGMVYKAKPHENLHHFRSVAAASGLPIMVYNNPVSYGVDLKPAHIAELADVPTIVAVKESSDDPRRITDLVNLVGGRFVLLGGVDDLALECCLLGAVGWVSGLVNAFPEENRQLWDLATAGRWEEARAIYRWYMPLLHLDTLPTLVQCIKLAAAEVGIGSETVRAPRRPLAGAEREEVLRIIRTGIATRPTARAGR